MPASLCLLACTLPKVKLPHLRQIAIAWHVLACCVLATAATHKLCPCSLAVFVNAHIGCCPWHGPTALVAMVRHELHLLVPFQVTQLCVALLHLCSCWMVRRLLNCCCCLRSAVLAFASAKASGLICLSILPNFGHLGKACMAISKVALASRHCICMLVVLATGHVR